MDTKEMDIEAMKEKGRKQMKSAGEESEEGGSNRPGQARLANAQQALARK